MSTGLKITLWAMMLCLPALAVLTGLYFVSYSTIEPNGVSFEGDNIIVYDPSIGFVPRPSGRSKQTDHAGPYNLYTDNRSARITIPGQNSPSRIDIMTIGCSFTWGLGLENQDTFAAKVAQHLGVPGSNFAMGSYGTVHSLLMLRRNRDLSPKLVVYGFITDHLRRNVAPCAPTYYPFCLDVAHVTWDSNDRPQITPPLSDGVKHIDLQLKAEAGGLNPVTWITHRVDVAFTWITHIVDVAFGRLTRRMAKSGASDDTRMESALAFLLGEMARTVDAMGAKLLIVYIPTDYAPPPPVLLRLVAELNVPFIDMTDVFRGPQEIIGNSSVYIPDDGHPSVAGHALIAEEIVHTVQRERLLAR